MPTQLRQQKFPFGSLRRDPHWSTQGLVFYSQFRPAGKLIDESFFGNDGTIVGATWQGDGLRFDDTTSDFVSIDKTAVELGIVRHATFSTWIKFDLATGVDTIVSDWNLLGFEIRKDGDGKFTFFVYPNNHRIASAGQSVAGVWTHIVGVMDGDNMFLYQDGIQVGQAVLGEDIGSPIGVEITWGKRPTGTNPHLGDIRHASIYNRALSASEISDLTIDPGIPMAQDISWMGKSPAVGANPKGPLTHPMYGPFAGPIAC